MLDPLGYCIVTRTSRPARCARTRNRPERNQRYAVRRRPVLVTMATVMGKSEDLVSVVLGIWRIGAVYVPLFTAFAESAIGSRLAEASAVVVLADRGNGTRCPTVRGTRFSSTMTALAACARSWPWPAQMLPRWQSAATHRWCTCSPRAPPERRRAWYIRCDTSPVGAVAGAVSRDANRRRV
jgi:acyl-CoA synthetase (AMP-forming)/AMP-acid ligase II